jgi:FAD binding domain
MCDVLTTAKSCRHYAMCKIDFLGSGVCASGLERRYASFYPVGRMDLYAALAEGRVPVTEQCVEIADSCDLCGKCDYQCYFVTEMRPSRVMKALKDHVEAFLAAGGQPEPPAEDALLQEIRAIVGPEWATSDRAIRLTYADDPCPIAGPRMPACVIMPGSRDEVSALLALLTSRAVPFVARGNGSSIMGLAMTEGAVIDLGRMTDIAFDEKNWTVRVGPGVSAFELQREAVARGYRVNVAEPAALVCANVVGTGIFSTFMAGYGTAADNFVDAEFVAADGTPFALSDPHAPNLFAFRQTDAPSPGICTAVSVKLHPMTDDEAGVLVPFDALDKAVDFVRDCAIRRIGLAVGILGGEYISAFMAPTRQLAADAKEILTRKLGIQYLVLVIGDRYALRSVREMGHPYLDQRMFRALNLGLPSVRSAQWIDLLAELSAGEPFSYLKADGFAELAETALAPSPALLVRDVDPELRPFFEQVYARPEMTDLVWLNMFRIVSSRMGREGHFLIFIVYLPLERGLIEEFSTAFRRIADRHGLRNDLGFITPADGGKRAILEYDYFFDQNDPDAIARIRRAGMEAAGVIEEYSARLGTIRWIRHVVNQGMCRKENLFYS